MRRFVSATVILLVGHAHCCLATEVGFSFSGTVSFVSPFAPPYGLIVPIGAPVNGRFMYDTDSSPMPVSPDEVRYRQQELNGFFVSFGDRDVLVRADDYIVSVGNNLPQVGGADVVVVQFRSDDSAIDGPLIVNGVPQPSGLLSITMTFAPDAFSSPSLPVTLPTDFASQFNSFSGPIISNAGLLFSVETVNEFQTGDYDFDSDVDSADYESWKADFGATVELFADGNRNGIVDASDYTLWRNRVIDLETDASVDQIVPELCSVELCIAGVFFLLAGQNAFFRRQ
jgi:hypothetical protein